MMDNEKVLVAGMMLAVLIVLAKVIIPIANAYAKRLEGTGGAAQRSAEMADLDARVRELEGREHRVAELEERLDFTERLLSQQREREQLGRGN
jgi:flagellar biosynthesis/type III secretory pathway M-ring protein FliF/YscJ